jgi:hypothetical protein
MITGYFNKEVFFFLSILFALGFVTILFCRIFDGVRKKQRKNTASLFFFANIFMNGLGK